MDNMEVYLCASLPVSLHLCVSFIISQRYTEHMKYTEKMLNICKQRMIEYELNKPFFTAYYNIFEKGSWR